MTDYPDTPTAEAKEKQEAAELASVRWIDCINLAMIVAVVADSCSVREVEFHCILRV